MRHLLLELLIQIYYFLQSVIPTTTRTTTTTTTTTFKLIERDARVENVSVFCSKRSTKLNVDKELHNVRTVQ